MEIIYNPEKYFCGSPNTLTLYFDNKEITVTQGVNSVTEYITKHPDYSKMVEAGAFTSLEKAVKATPTRRKPTAQPLQLEV